MKKVNYIFSYDRRLWISNLRFKYIANPHIYHFLEKENYLKSNESYDVNDFRRADKKDLINDSKYIDKKYYKYLEIIYPRLNQIHNSNFDKDFWKKSLSMGFIRYVTVAYNTFKILEDSFDFKKHQCNILSEKSFCTPFDFEEHRSRFQNSDLGQEQLFSIYINSFYKNNDFKKLILNYKVDRKKFFDLIKQKIKPIYNFLKFRTRSKKIKTGILGSFFKSYHIKNLIKNSSKKISLIDLEISNKEKKINLNFRKIISSPRDDFDRFDLFFFETLNYCMPKIFVENFDDTLTVLKNKLLNYSSLKQIISENWISSTKNSIFLALAQKKNIIHINNEHNGFFHPFVGSYNNHIIEMCDIFTTVGWKSNSNKIIDKASLYYSKEYCNHEEKTGIVFFSGPALVFKPHMSSGYSYCEESVMKNINFNINFFKSLKNSTLSKIIYRPYPNQKLIDLMFYSKEFYYEKNNIQLYTNSVKIDAEKQIRNAKLVIHDYISTSYIESLLLNIPTVFFFNKQSLFLIDEHKDFFNPLIDCKICHTDPKHCADFINQIFSDPSDWWNSEIVQNAKNEFLKRNINKPEKMFNYLINISK